MPSHRTIRIKPFGHRLAERFCGMSRGILRVANRGLPRFAFMRSACDLLMEFSQADRVEFRSQEGDRNYLCALDRGGRHVIARNGEALTPALADLQQFCLDIQAGRQQAPETWFSRNGGFSILDDWSADLARRGAWGKAVAELTEEGAYRSVALLPFEIDDCNPGSLVLKSHRDGFFTSDEIQFYEGLAQSLGASVADRRAQEALRARMKELDCLYALTRELAEGETMETLGRVAVVLAGAWVWPEGTRIRIEVDGETYGDDTPGVGRSVVLPVTAGGRERGCLTIDAPEDDNWLAEEHFAQSEKQLLSTVAGKIAAFIERQDAAQERGHLNEQLMHADRLATIGQLAAGVAHELNEPLGNILGFAQLTIKEEGLPEQCHDDIGRIIKSSLHAREVIRKLMIFARRTPTRSEPVDLNRVVEEGLSFLEARCVKGGIRLETRLDPAGPRLLADPSQVLQILVNLVVNGIQAMPDGGELRLETACGDGEVRLSVEDDGVGMDEEVQRKAFLPFFTTKDVDSGTGLGLAVVHGIVTAHDGRIELDSEPGRGSRFDVIFPSLDRGTE